MKKNEIATVTKKNEIATVTKNNANEKMMTVDEVFELFHASPFKKINYSNASQKYTGFSDFSVNFAKSSYNVFMSENVATKLHLIDKCTKNSVDSTKHKYRNYKYIVKSNNELKKLIKLVNAL